MTSAGALVHGQSQK